MNFADDDTEMEGKIFEYYCMFLSKEWTRQKTPSTPSESNHKPEPEMNNPEQEPDGVEPEEPPEIEAQPEDEVNEEQEPEEETQPQEEIELEVELKKEPEPGKEVQISVPESDDAASNKAGTSRIIKQMILYDGYKFSWHSLAG